MTKKLTYKTSGVDIAKANVFVDAIQKSIKTTLTPYALKRKGSFGGLCALPQKKYTHPILVSSTDGVGTKLLLAKQFGVHTTVGIDLVAMNVNDILCVGAEPLFFLDYIACGKLRPKVLCAVVEGIAEGCRQSGCSLIGGETAEMPGMYASDDYDLAGFAVGVVEKKNIIDGSKIRAGDMIIGLPSSGLHSNGFSLVRKALPLAVQKKYARTLLTPTKIYAKEVSLLTTAVSVRGIAHMTGGAYYEKLTRIVPQGLCFRIDRSSWEIPEIFRMVQSYGRIDDAEMYRTLNMGIGLAVVIAPGDYAKVQRVFTKNRVSHFVIGDVIKAKGRKIEFSA